MNTFGGVETEGFAVGAFSAAVESFDAGVVKGIEVETVQGADGLFAAVHLLQDRWRRSS